MLHCIYIFIHILVLYFLTVCLGEVRLLTVASKK